MTTDHRTVESFIGQTHTNHGCADVDRLPTLPRRMWPEGCFDDWNDANRRAGEAAAQTTAAYQRWADEHTDNPDISEETR